MKAYPPNNSYDLNDALKAQRQVDSSYNPVSVPYQSSTVPNYQANHPSAQIPMAQNPINVNAFATCNQGIANGFGPMFYNMRDTTFTSSHSNSPEKKQAALHLCILVFNCIFYGCLVLGIIGLNSFLDIGSSIAIIVSSYIVYLIAACCCNDIKSYIQNTKSFDAYQQTYNKMTAGQGFFKFWIECYHYVTTHRRRGGSSRRKVVTHTATQIFTLSQTIDQSGVIEGIMDTKSFIFLHYIKRFYFDDDVSQNKFTTAFNNFVARNTRDVHQNYSHTFEIQGYEEHVAFTAMGDNSKSIVFFYVFVLLGLALPYACIFERAVARYQVGLLKRLSV